MIQSTSSKYGLIFALALGLLSVQSIVAAEKSETKSNPSKTIFKVAHVAENDDLNVRISAGVGNDIVTTIPFDGDGIELLGDKVTIGKTNWVLVKWKGISGWVSKYYLEKQQAVVAEVVSTSSASKEVVEKSADSKETDKVSAQAGSESSAQTVASTESDKSSIDADTGSTAVVQEEWVLQCGNKTPYWKVQVHPEWMNVAKGDYETGLKITAKKQDKNRWNTALKTVVHGKNGRNNLKMTIKYAYSKRCYDTLSGLRVPYKVTTEFNGEELTGCCRAVKIEKPLANDVNDTKLSLK